LHIFSRLPSAWESYDSCNDWGLNSAQTVATMAMTVCMGSAKPSTAVVAALSASE